MIAFGFICENEQKEEERTAYKEEKQNTQLNLEVKVFQLGSAYWQKLYDEADKMKLLSYKDASLLQIAASIEKTGNVPSPAQARAIMAIRDRLEEQGVFV